MKYEKGNWSLFIKSSISLNRVYYFTKLSLGCITITGFTGVCDSIPTFTNLVSNEKNPIRIHPSTDNYILNINAAQMVEKGGSKSNQIASNGVIHFVDEV